MKFHPALYIFIIPIAYITIFFLHVWLDWFLKRISWLFRKIKEYYVVLKLLRLLKTISKEQDEDIEKGIELTKELQKEIKKELIETFKD